MEQRTAYRYPMIKSVEVVDGHRSLAGAVFNLSATGARVRLFSPAVMPEVVMLRLPDGTIRSARRCWQRGAEVGFEFQSAVAALE
ncbi:PilZ domain-containing protein [Dankookia sp. GCM10030260]|uniref:PilZ domain-containing protein n=1 Tax=Dankookia sp. GCM10030260 TaxID=3273390 RepID=UPI00361DC7E1